MAESSQSIVQEAIDVAIGERGEIGVQVAAYLDSELVIDQWGGLADETTGQEVDGDTLFPVFSNIKAMTATALHIQAERGLVDYYQPVAKYWPEFGKYGKDKGTVFDALDPPHRRSPDAGGSYPGVDVRLGLDGGADRGDAPALRAGHPQRLHGLHLRVGCRRGGAPH